MWLLPVLLAPLMLQDPSLSETSIAFSRGGYVWTVPRYGGAEESAFWLSVAPPDPEYHTADGSP